MSETITTGSKYVSLRRGDRYHFMAQCPDDMPEEVWDEVAELIASALRAHINRSSRAREYLKRANLEAGVTIPTGE